MLDNGKYMLFINGETDEMFAYGAESFEGCLDKILNLITSRKMMCYNIPDIDKFSISLSVPAENLPPQITE